MSNTVIHKDLNVFGFHALNCNIALSLVFKEYFFETEMSLDYMGTNRANGNDNVVKKLYINFTYK